MAVPGRSLPDARAPIPIPTLVKDATWSLRPWPVLVSMGGHEFEIPALAAADWLTVLMTEPVDLDDILPGLLDGQQYRAMEDLLSEQLLDLRHLHQAALDCIGLASGRPWYVTIRIIGTVQASWNVIGGEFVLKAVDARTLSLAAWLDAAYLILLRAMDDKETMIFNAKIMVPPPGYEQDTMEPELTADSFLAMGPDE